MVTKAADINVHVCPKYHAAVELIGRRWTGAILSAMLMGATRFTDIIHAEPGLSDRLLSERLKDLENAQIDERGIALVGLYDSVLTDTEVCTIWATDLASHTALLAAGDPWPSTARKRRCASSTA